jgi:cytochrome P450
MASPIPIPDNQTSLRALRAMYHERTVLGAMQAFHEGLGDVFRITLPGFNPVMIVGPEAARFVLVTARDDVRWRSEGDPVTALLRGGVLVVDGEAHDAVRRVMNPALHRHMLGGYVEAMWRCTDQITREWGDKPLNMLDEMRRIALLILMETLYKVDFTPELDRLWNAVLKSIQFISPGMWIIWRDVPRPGYARAIQQLDEYLYRIIRERRTTFDEGRDLLGMLIASGLDDDLIRDQLLTMLIAGHDTSTALLSWALYLLGKHPDILERARTEVDTIIGHESPTLDAVANLHYLGQIIDETLRLYPPIHLGSRVAAVDLEFQDYHIPAGTRVMYSIYLTHRMGQYWDEPERFNPDRFAPVCKHPPYTFLPFGGGPRNCIGAAFAQVEAKVVLARILQQYDLTLLPGRVRPYMGATLEPRPGVNMRVQRLQS